MAGKAVTGGQMPALASLSLDRSHGSPLPPAPVSLPTSCTPIACSPCSLFPTPCPASQVFNCSCAPWGKQQQWYHQSEEVAAASSWAVSRLKGAGREGQEERGRWWDRLQAQRERVDGQAARSPIPTPWSALCNPQWHAPSLTK